ncbi:MAG: hypothetical protein ACYCTE_17665, partial [Acidimicrobiales bacterium]
AALTGTALAASFLVAPTVASATDTSTGNGYVEICKTFATPPIAMDTTASFTFKISGLSTATTVAAGTCSGEISVTTGSHTITETPGSWYQVGSISELPGQSYLTSSNLATGTATVMVTAGTSVDTVSYVNDPVTGYLEVCKQAAAGSGLTGSYSFDVTGADGYTSSTTVPVGACSNPAMQVPAGQVTVTEGGTNLYVTGIVATLNGSGNELVGAPDLTNGTATATVVASANASTQTDVTYTNDVVALKVCKVWDASNGVEPGGSATMFPFTFSASGAAGPNTAAAPVSLQAGTFDNPVCSDPVSYRPGTTVSITEGIVAGTKVESMGATGAESVVPGSVSITGRTISVVVGTPVTAAGAPGDEAIVTFVDEAADPGTLKICKDLGSPAPNGTSFSFTVSGVPGTTVVPLGSCSIVGGSTTPVLFPYNSVQTVTELASTGNATSSITAIPTYVNEIVGGIPTLTSETVVSGTPTLGSTGTTSAVNLVIGEGTITEVTFTDTDPPVTSSNSTGSSTSSSSTGSSTTPSSTGSSTTPVIVFMPPAVPAAPSTVTSPSTEQPSGVVVSVKVTRSLTAAERVALVKRHADLAYDAKLLGRVLAATKGAERAVARSHGATHVRAVAWLRRLTAERVHVVAQIKELKVLIQRLEALA